MVRALVSAAIKNAMKMAGGYSEGSGFESRQPKASMQGFECSYSPLQGCMVKVDGNWIDYDRLRVIE